MKRIHIYEAEPGDYRFWEADEWEEYTEVDDVVFDYLVTQDAARVALSHGMKEVSIRVKGAGMGRDSSVRAVQAVGLNVSSIVDTTPVPHNGCRPPKRRRV